MTHCLHRGIFVNCMLVDSSFLYCFRFTCDLFRYGSFEVGYSGGFDSSVLSLMVMSRRGLIFRNASPAVQCPIQCCSRSLSLCFSMVVKIENANKTSTSERRTEFSDFGNSFLATTVKGFPGIWLDVFIGPKTHRYAVYLEAQPSTLRLYQSTE